MGQEIYRDADNEIADKIIEITTEEIAETIKVLRKGQSGCE